MADEKKKGLQHIFVFKVDNDYIEIDLSEDELQKVKDFVHKQNIKHAEKLHAELNGKMSNELIVAIYNLERSPMYYEVRRILKEGWMAKNKKAMKEEVR